MLNLVRCERKDCEIPTDDEDKMHVSRDTCLGIKIGGGIAGRSIFDLGLAVANRAGNSGDVSGDEPASLDIIAI